jgi:siroheme synthase
MPAALVENATLDAQRVVEGTLSSIPEQCRLENVKPPALLIVGEVVRLRSRLAWFGAADAKSGTDHVLS